MIIELSVNSSFDIKANIFHFLLSDENPNWNY